MPEDKKKKKPEDNLPDWISPVKGKPGYYTCDRDKHYPEILEEIKAHEGFRFLGAGDTEDYVAYSGELDQYWLEIVYVIAKMDFQMALRMAKVDMSKTVHNSFKSKDKSTWKLANYPEGRIAKLKEQYGGENFQYRMQVGREARQVFKKIRGYDFGG